MLKISHAACLGLSVAILVQFALEMFLAAQNCQKSIKPIFNVQGHPRSLLSMATESWGTTSY